MERINLDLPAKPSNRCIFCENWADSREDIIPRWVNGTWRLEDGHAPAEIRLQRGDRPPLVQSKLATKQTSSRCVCQQCNSGWMSQLESEIRPTLGAMINGYQRKLSQTDQLNIARWAALKAACYDADPKARTEGSIISKAARMAIRGGPSPLEPGQVPVRWAVWLGTSDRQRFLALMPCAWNQHDCEAHLTRFTFTFCLGHVVLVVQGRSGGSNSVPFVEQPFGYDLQCPDCPPLVTISPARSESINWPRIDKLDGNLLGEALTLGLPDDIRKNSNVSQTIKDIRDEDREIDCTQCGRRHARVPITVLPVDEPSDWLPGNQSVANG